MNSTLRVLHLEDSLLDAELVHAAISSEGFVCEVQRVDNRADFIKALDGNAFDLILADFTLPSFDGVTALGIAQERCSRTPFLFVSGTIGEDLAIECLKGGATDYVLKHRLTRLGPSVRRALREAETRAAQLRAQESILKQAQLLDLA